MSGNEGPLQEHDAGESSRNAPIPAGQEGRVEEEPRPANVDPPLENQRDHLPQASGPAPAPVNSHRCQECPEEFTTLGDLKFVSSTTVHGLRQLQADMRSTAAGTSKSTSLPSPAPTKDAVLRFGTEKISGVTSGIPMTIRPHYSTALTLGAGRNLQERELRVWTT